jgi:hypothetical protein
LMLYFALHGAETMVMRVSIVRRRRVVSGPRAERKFSVDLQFRDDTWKYSQTIVVSGEEPVAPQLEHSARTILRAHGKGERFDWAASTPRSAR